MDTGGVVKGKGAVTNANYSGGKFSWIVRVYVEDDKVKSWNWFEGSYDVSQAYHGKK